MFSLPKNENLDIAHFQRLFDNMSECYKLFWFRAIVDSVMEKQSTVSFNQLIDYMISDAWYMVNEYRLNLGPRDTLESLVHYASTVTGLKSSEERNVIIRSIKDNSDRLLMDKKKTLTLNVPYRLQVPLLGIKNTDFNTSVKNIASTINNSDNTIYKFGPINGLDTLIYIDENWAGYITTNYEIISGWINYNMISYLQRRNPSVPGIPNKLFPPQERKLDLVKKFWKSISEVSPIVEIYGNETLGKDISIDHFVPWSYVAHDELWNLSPTTRSINSQKGNKLPIWDEYFPKFCDLKYEAYQTSFKYEKILHTFNKCVDEHINSLDVKAKLYRKDLTKNEYCSILSEIIRPSYDAAINLGFGIWEKN